MTTNVPASPQPRQRASLERPHALVELIRLFVALGSFVVRAMPLQTHQRAMRLADSELTTDLATLAYVWTQDRNAPEQAKQASVESSGC